MTRVSPLDGKTTAPQMKRVKETMSKPAERNLIVGLDIGTSQVKAVVGELLEDDQISIVGVGTHASKGMDKGGVKRFELGG